MPASCQDQPALPEGFQRFNNFVSEFGQFQGVSKQPQSLPQDKLPKTPTGGSRAQGDTGTSLSRAGGRTGWGHPLLAPGASLGTAIPLSLLEAPGMMQGRHWWDWGHWGGFQALSPLSPIPISPLPPPPVPMEVGGPYWVALGGGAPVTPGGSGPPWGHCCCCLSLPAVPCPWRPPWGFDASPPFGSTNQLGLNFWFSILKSLAVPLLAALPTAPL